MELYSTNSNVKKTELVDDKGSVVYRITTASQLTTSQTTISHVKPRSDTGISVATVVGEVVWHTMDDDEIMLHGQHYDARNFVPNHGFTIARREFKGTSGRAYYWVENVLHTSDGAEAARWHNKSRGFFKGQPHKAYLHVADSEIQEDMDVVILTLVYHLSRSGDEVAGSMSIIPFSETDDASPARRPSH
ncbi:unnamed protein product [Peniophora sp. CBMAI 1063]|nr:unnamed protein product [Peniophora sp. CBMAI 1063]